ncbi:unnamed protein product [Psylliodes chrysocephalus]|uniref:Uncharacterized protein n=1 Tax=Psylliodes chrysocephalus TaxID=3402493 RepID=A0A9P0CPZ7_9CUCU|nr:unnamed protein product [Psylliodes chrysocephala]
MEELCTVPVNNNNVVNCVCIVCSLLKKGFSSRNFEEKTDIINSNRLKRSFSALKRIKSFIRNSTNEDILSNLTLISIEKHFVKQLSENPKFYNDVIDKFAAIEDRS